MNRPASDRDLQVRYLLGNVSEDERVAIEEKFFANEEFFEELQSIEDDLVDSYVAGELSGEDRRKFEKRYLATVEGREKVAAARHITGVASRRTGSAAWPRLLLAAAAIGFLIVLVWLVPMRSRPGQTPPQASTATPVTEIPATRPAPQPPAVIAITLSSGLLRGDEEMPRLDLRDPIDLVQFRLELDQLDFENYVVELQTAEGQSIWTSAPIARSESHVSADIPADRFRSGDYILMLSGVTEKDRRETAGEYILRVTRH